MTSPAPAPETASVATEIDSALLSLPNAARYLDVPVETLRSWIKADWIPKVKMGRRVHVKRADLDQFIENHYQVTA